MGTTPSKPISIIYHADCADGFGAAWAAWKKFGDQANYFPVFHKTEPPTEIENTDVYTLDYSYSKEQIEAWKPRVKSWTIIDHHASNKEIIPAADHSLYDLEHSGAVLAWNYFHPDTAVPTLLSYVEDSDLWKFILPNSSYLNEAIGLRALNFETWNTLAESFDEEAKRIELEKEGNVLRLKAEQSIAKLVEKSTEQIEFEGYTVLSVNSPNYVSEIGNALAIKQPPFGIVWSRRGKKVVVSMRANGAVDVSQIAKKYGGGGHPNAASFSWESDEFLTIRKPEQSDELVSGSEMALMLIAGALIILSHLAHFQHLRPLPSQGLIMQQLK